MLYWFQEYSTEIQIYMCIYSFSESFLYRLLQNIEYSALCYTVGPFRLSILDIIVCICKSQHNFYFFIFLFLFFTF